MVILLHHYGTSGNPSFFNLVSDCLFIFSNCIIDILWVCLFVCLFLSFGLRKRQAACVHHQGKVKQLFCMLSFIDFSLFSPFIHFAVFSMVSLESLVSIPDLWLPGLHFTCQTSSYSEPQKQFVASSLLIAFFPL